MTTLRLPFALRLMKRWLPGAVGAEVVEDIQSLWLERRLRSPRRAWLWLWGQVLSLHTLRLGRLLKRRSARRWDGVRSIRGGGWTMGRMRQLRYAARGLARRPGFTLTVVTTLALGIGANTAIFSVVDGVLLEPLPYPDDHELVFVWGTVEGDGNVLLSGPQAAEAVGLDVFSNVAQAFGFGATSMVRDELPEPVRTLTVGYNFFDVLGVSPLLGRTFRAEDEYKLTNEQIRDPDFERPVQAAMLSYAFWRQNFGGDPGAVGQIVRISGHRHEIVGVMPPGFRTYLPSELNEADPEDVWVMSTFDQPSFPRDTRFVRVTGRLRDGASLQDAQVALDRLSAWQRDTYLEDSRDGFRMRASSLRQEASATARGPLLILLTAVGLVLLIACANVATLLLVRASEREGELRLRRALGATRTALAGIGLTESLLLALFGGAAALLLAPLLTGVLVRLAPGELPRVEAVDLDGTVLLFTAVVTLLVALLAGLLPTLRSVRTAVAGPGARATPTHGFHWTGGVLAVMEITLAVVLVTGTGLLLRSLANTLSVDPGFDSKGVYVWEETLASSVYPTWESRVALFRRVQETLMAEPGVRAVGLLAPVPFDGADRGEIRLGIQPDARSIVADYRRTGPGALEALGVELISGRFLEWTDMEDFDRLHAVVDERFAEQAWPGESAVGQVIGILRREYRLGSQVRDEWKRVEVVGTVRSIRGKDVRSPDGPSVYVTYSQNMWGNSTFVAKSEIVLTDQSVRRAAATADPRPLVQNFQSLSAVAARQLAPLRFALTLIGLFAGLGLLLAATGTYGLLSYTVGSREREFHIRAAIGANRKDLAKLVLRFGFTVAGLGLAAGWAGAWGLTRFLESLLFGVTPTDTATFAGVALFLAVVVSAACWVPSWRAARTDPAGALR